MLQLRKQHSTKFAGRSRKSKRSQRSQYLPAWILLLFLAWALFPNLVPGTIGVMSRMVSNVGPPVVDGAAYVVGGVAEVAWDGGKIVGGVVVDGVVIAAHAVGDVPSVVSGVFSSSSGGSTANLSIAPLFTQPVDHWSDDIARWSIAYNLDPNLLATVMQIESCGHPTIASYAGAQGLFQVMPFHFTREENQLDPDTNARRGALFLNECLGRASGDVGLALACYNGGPSVITASPTVWNQQVRDYYAWGTGIYADTLTNQSRSNTLDRWLAAGGDRLCRSASATLGLE